MNPPSGLGSMRYVNFVIMRLSSTVCCAIVARFADRTERNIGVGRTPLHDARRRTRHHGLQTLLSSRESTLFVRTKDPGAPRHHSRVRCETANQCVWPA